MTLEELATEIQPLLARGYQSIILIGGTGAEVQSIMGGDCNCPRPKFYDPQDGHGWTYIHMDDVPDDVMDTFGNDTYELESARWMIAEAERLEGTAR